MGASTRQAEASSVARAEIPALAAVGAVNAALIADRHVACLAITDWRIAKECGISTTATDKQLQALTTHEHRLPAEADDVILCDGDTVALCSGPKHIGVRNRPHFLSLHPVPRRLDRQAIVFLDFGPLIQQFGLQSRRHVHHVARHECILS